MRMSRRIINNTPIGVATATCFIIILHLMMAYSIWREARKRPYWKQEGFTIKLESIAREVIEQAKELGPLTGAMAIGGFLIGSFDSADELITIGKLRSQS